MEEEAMDVEDVAGEPKKKRARRGSRKRLGKKPKGSRKASVKEKLASSTHEDLTSDEDCISGSSKPLQASIEGNKTFSSAAKSHGPSEPSTSSDTTYEIGLQSNIVVNQEKQEECISGSSKPLQASIEGNKTLSSAAKCHKPPEPSASSDTTYEIGLQGNIVVDQEEEELMCCKIVSENVLADVSLIAPQEVLEEEEVCEEGMDTTSQLEEDPTVGIIDFDDLQLSPQDEFLLVTFIAETLTSQISSRWIVDIVNGNTIRLSMLTLLENVSVQKSIVWSKGITKLFVNNRPISESHGIWNVLKHDALGVDEVCVNLQDFATVIEHAAVCAGIVKYKQQWAKSSQDGKGFVETFYENYECFRSKNCSLIFVEYEKCDACKMLQKAMKDQAWRSAQGKDQSKTNNRFLSKEQLAEKTAELQKKNRRLEKQLAKKIKKEMKTGQKVNVSHSESQDFTKIFESSALTKVQEIFWAEQKKALAARQKNPRSMRWHPFMIRLALHIQMKSQSAYDYLGNFITLPSKRLLYDYTHVVEAKEGVQEATLKDLQDKINKYEEEHHKYFNLSLDEVYVRAGVVINRKTGDVIGYTHLTEVELALAKLEADMSGFEFVRETAKKVLVFLAQAITNPTLGVVGIYPTRELNAPQLFSRSWEVIYRMESYGLKALCITCDGAAVNKKFIRMHPGIDKHKSFIYSTINLVSNERRPLFFIMDPPHLLKTLRNCLANSYSHKKSRKMWNNNEDLSWEILEILQAHTFQEKFKDHRLTRAHVKLTAFSCMKVIFASQAMSDSVVNAIETLSNILFQGKDTVELCRFIKIVNDFFDCMNSSGDPHGKRNKKNPLLLPYMSVNDERFSFLVDKVLKYFEDWEKSINTRKGKFSKAAKEKMFISHQSYESLKITIHGFIGTVKYLLDEPLNAPSVDGRTLNQDKLEQFFGILDMSSGGNRNMNVSELLNKCRTIQIQGQAARPSKRGNTTVEDTWEPDSTPLPKLSKWK